MAESKGEMSVTSSEGNRPKEGVLIRGADGSLYALTEDDLKPFKVNEEKAKALTHILNKADKHVVTYDLSHDNLDELGAMARSVATHVEVFLHRKEP
jgi:hypothetical protein